MPHTPIEQKPLQQSIQEGMNWNDLRYFLALVRAGSVSGAGRKLGVEHTTVARRITALERQLGSRLFDRLSSGYEMTQVAENLYPHAITMEELMQVADREVFGMDTQLKGNLKLTASYDVFNRLLTAKLHHFTDQYPNIEMELLSSTSLADLANRQADIAVRLSPKPPEYLIGKQVLPLNHGLYASSSYLENMYQETNGHNAKLILWEHEYKKPEWVNDHFPNGKVTLRANEVMTMMEAVKNHLGIARLPCYVADAEPNLRRLDLPLTPSNWGIWVLSHVDLRSTARVRVCREFLIDTISAQKNLIQGLDSHYF